MIWEPHKDHRKYSDIRPRLVYITYYGIDQEKMRCYNHWLTKYAICARTYKVEKHKYNLNDYIKDLKRSIRMSWLSISTI